MDEAEDSGDIDAGDILGVNTHSVSDASIRAGWVCRCSAPASMEVLSQTLNGCLPGAIESDESDEAVCGPGACVARQPPCPAPSQRVPREPVCRLWISAVIGTGMFLAFCWLQRASSLYRFRVVSDSLHAVSGALATPHSGPQFAWAAWTTGSVTATCVRCQHMHAAPGRLGLERCPLTRRTCGAPAEIGVGVQPPPTAQDHGVAVPMASHLRRRACAAWRRGRGGSVGGCCVRTGVWQHLRAHGRAVDAYVPISGLHLPTNALLGTGRSRPSKSLMSSCFILLVWMRW